MLDLARMRIEDLEREGRVLEQEKEELAVSIEQLRRRWIALGGARMAPDGG